MLQRMRQGAQSFGAKVLVGIIIVVLALFGFGAFNIFVSPDPAVATVNGEDIPRSRVEMEVELQRREIINRFGEEIAMELIDTGTIRRSVIDNLINRTLLIQAAEEMNLALSDDQIDRMIVETPEFQVDGQFDSDRFRMLVASIGHTPASFRREYARDVLLSIIDSSVTETPLVTEVELRQNGALVTQTRDLAYLRFRAEDFVEEAGARVADEDVEAYYDAYRRDFITEERVDLELLALSVSELAENAAVTVTDEQVRELYEQERARFDATEERHAAHILVSLEDRTLEQAHQRVQEIQERLLAGEDFAALAREYSDDAGSAREGGDLGYVTEGMMVPEFEGALWRMDEGDVVGPVETPFGLHLIRLVDVHRAEYPPLEEQEPELREQLRTVFARERFAELVLELDRWAFDMQDSLQPVAEQFGLEIQRVEGVSREQGPGPFQSADLRREAFSRDVLEGMNSRVVTVTDTAYVLRLDEHHPPRQLPLDEVADEIRARLEREEAQELARRAVAEAEARLRQGDSAGVVARTFDKAWEVVEGARRDQPGVPGPVAWRAFQLSAPADGRSVGNAVIGEGDFAVVTVTRVIEGNFDAMRTGEREMLRRQMRQAIGSQEFEALFRTIRDEARIRRRS
jgi:peptidyl-prolyl cis-trans isomerase D